MSPLVILGALFLVPGIWALATAMRHHREQRPRYALMLIAGMMATAFGIVIAGFAIVYQRTAPLDLNAAAEGTP
jgi:uncharacterized membrane protein HdeD (DUF308 family)